MERMFKRDVLPTTNETFIQQRMKRKKRIRLFGINERKRSPNETLSLRHEKK